MHSGMPALQALLTAEMEKKISPLILGLRDSTGDFSMHYSRSVPSFSSSSGGGEKNSFGRRGGGKGPNSKWRVCFQAVGCPSEMAAREVWETGCFSGGWAAAVF